MMKRFFSFAVMITALSFAFTGCNKDEDPAPQKNIAKLGAQANTSFGGFLSIDMKRVYTQAEASQNQDKIDILCFFEEAGGNNIAVAAPGSNITGIFIGETSPVEWATKNQTYFTNPATAITVAEFDQLKDGDAAVQSYYDETVTSGNRKKKDLKVDDIYAFKTAGGKYGIFKVISVVQGETGYVEFEYKIK